MNIIITINHPAHVHYFRNFIRLMEEKGHHFYVVNRDNPTINKLLDHYGIAHTVRVKNRKNATTFKILSHLFKYVKYLVGVSRRFHADFFLGFAAAPCALTGFVTRKPSVLIDDTDHNIKNQVIYLPFCSRVFTPFYFSNSLFKKGWVKRKTEKLQAYIEQYYLHSNYYNPDDTVLTQLGLVRKQYVIVRFSAFDASHDKGAHSLDVETKKSIIRALEEKYRVVLSLEAPTDDEFFNKRIMKFPPHLMHDLLYHAHMIVTEGATMASEAYVLGVPYLYINPIVCGYIYQQCGQSPERARLSSDSKEVLTMLKEMMEISVDQQACRKEVESFTISPTDYLTWFVENYPESKQIIHNNPDYQLRFK